MKKKFSKRKNEKKKIEKSNQLPVCQNLTVDLHSIHCSHMSSFQARDAKINAHGAEQTSRSITRLGSGHKFIARSLPKKSVISTPAAMKTKRAAEEKQRQQFRLKVEMFYNSKPELQSKWEKARDTLLVKYASATKWKLFEIKLIEKYGKEFQLFDVSASSSRCFEPMEDVVEDGRVPCSYCSRKFVIDRVFKHETICVKTKGKKGANVIHIKRHEDREKIRIQKIREKEKNGVRSKNGIVPARRGLKPRHSKVVNIQRGSLKIVTNSSEGEEKDSEKEEKAEEAEEIKDYHDPRAALSEIEQLEYQLLEMKRYQALNSQQKNN